MTTKPLSLQVTIPKEMILCSFSLTYDYPASGPVVRGDVMSVRFMLTDCRIWQNIQVNVESQVSRKHWHDDTDDDDDDLYARPSASHKKSSDKEITYPTVSDQHFPN